MKTKEWIRIVERDFEVKFLQEHEKGHLFYTLDHSFHKFVNLNFDKFTSSSTQNYILRYEIASKLRKHLTSGHEMQSSRLTTGDIVLFIGDETNLRIEIFLKRSDNTIVIEHESPFIQSMLNDYLALEKAQKNTLTLKDRNAILSTLLKLDEEKRDRLNRLNEIDTEILFFEKEIRKANNAPQTPLLSIYYDTFLDKSNAYVNGLEINLMEDFDYFLLNDSCDCNNPNCFFDIMKELQKHYFPYNYVIDNSFDATLVKDEFKNIWEALNDREKAIINFLFVQFGNSTLLNLGFLLKDFDYYGYLDKICSPYEPDSLNERAVRMISGMARFFGVYDFKKPN